MVCLGEGSDDNQNLIVACVENTHIVLNLAIAKGRHTVEGYKPGTLDPGKNIISLPRSSELQ